MLKVIVSLIERKQEGRMSITQLVLGCKLAPKTKFQILATQYENFNLFNVGNDYLCTLIRGFQSKELLSQRVW